MASQVIYSSEKDLKSKIELRHFIPYRVDHNSKYEANRAYYNAYWGQAFRVIDVSYDKNGFLDNATVRWDDGCYGLFCTELSPGDYILRKDHKEIYKESEIVNTDKVYTGAEIAYWFYTHKINQFNPRYKSFWEWIDLYSHRRIQDWTRYQLYGKEMSDGSFEQCRIIKVK